MNRKQRRTVSALKRRGEKVSLPISKEDEFKQSYFHKCAALGELTYNLNRQEIIKSNLLKEIGDLTEQFLVLKKEAESAPKANADQSPAAEPKAEGNPVST
jgi:hypothetical protein